MLLFVVLLVETRLCFHDYFQNLAVEVEGHITCLNLSVLAPKSLKYNTLRASYSLLRIFVSFCYKSSVLFLSIQPQSKLQAFYHNI